MKQVPYSIDILFILGTLFAVFLFYRAGVRQKGILAILLAWVLIQMGIGLSGFYTDTQSLPPRFLLLILPPFLAIIGLFTNRKGRDFIESMDGKVLTWLHVVRIPVEIALFVLFLHNQVPELMTFGGKNFDIAAGISAPFVAWLGYHRKQLDRSILLGWNFLCLALLCNIVINAILSAPVPFQQQAFDMPNVAVMYFPYVWLPSVVVPLVLFSHLACIWQLYRRRESEITEPLNQRATEFDSGKP